MKTIVNYKKSFSNLIDLILPSRCPVSGEIVEQVGAISSTAWKELTFITDPKCSCCGIPFAIETLTDASLPDDFLCADCLSAHRPYHKARSVFAYDDGCRKMILAFKHGDALHLHTTLAPLLYRLGSGLITPESVFIPVPLHWLRLMKRRYNQSAILANELSKISRNTCIPDALRRMRHTPPQGHKTARDRHKNVSGAFEINPRHISALKGKSVILIDDVFTTGATLEECCRILQTADVARIDVLTVARVVKN